MYMPVTKSNYVNLTTGFTPKSKSVLGNITK